MRFKERLNQLLEERGISQKELAQRINVDETAMSRYVNGTRTPRIDILTNIAKEFDVSIEYLIGEEEKEYKYGEIKNVICRNVHEMTDSQRMELMEILLRKSKK